jgi:hypothetical protein
MYSTRIIVSPKPIADYADFAGADALADLGHYQLCGRRNQLRDLRDQRDLPAFGRNNNGDSLGAEMAEEFGYRAAKGITPMMSPTASKTSDVTKLHLSVNR